MTTDIPVPVAVLGLGRMGTALTERLVECGRSVTTWSRSGRTVAGATPAEEPAAAVADAPLVLLSLFDAAACRAVLEQCRGALGGGTVVLNTSTVGPDEAAELETMVRGTGAGYVHVPVVGSTGAARSGQLDLLVGSAEQHGADAAQLLAELGDPLWLAGSEAAAAAKLVANGGLGGLLAAVADARTAAAEAGLEAETALDVLARSALGGLVTAKRGRLAGADRRAADFTVAALAKDLGLLARQAPSAAPLARWVGDALADGRARPDDDVAALCPAPTAPRMVPEARLTLPAGVPADAPEVAPVVAYALGHATGDPSHFRRAFLPTAHVEGLRDGAFVSWGLEEYCGLFDGRPAPDEAARSRHLDRLDVTGTVAGATMTLRHGPDTFTDVFVLVRVEGEWRIANKAYHRA